MSASIGEKKAERFNENNYNVCYDENLADHMDAMTVLVDENNTYNVVGFLSQNTFIINNIGVLQKSSGGLVFFEIPVDRGYLSDYIKISKLPQITLRSLL